VYPTVGDSYEDHSKFLLKNKRYASLFQLDKKDYKGWAHGLKSAGYATNPQYATLLISLIEESALHEIDQEDQALFIKPTQNISVIHIHENKVRYVLAEKGDTYYKISQRTGLTLRQLRLYNESFHQRDILKEGDKIYLDPRRKRSKTKAIITLTKNMTLREIAQEEALTVKSLLRKNQGVTADETLSKGKEIRLK
jgi:LysM repeat protein